MAADPIRDALKGAAASIASAEPEQPALFEVPCADPRGEIAAAQARSAKGGRPKGAQNLATRELREFLLARMGGKTPQEQLAQWASLGPEGLAQALHCTTLEAFDRWRAILEYLGKFYMAPMVPVDADGKPAPAILVSIGGATGLQLANGDVVEPWRYVEQNQALIEGELEPSQKQEGEK
jgi:hypothetical protein